MKVSVRERRTRLTHLIEAASRGEEVTIVRSGVSVAQLVAVGSPKIKRPLGMDRGSVWVADDFDAPLPPEELAGFYGTKAPKPMKPGEKTFKRGRR